MSKNIKTDLPKRMILIGGKLTSVKIISYDGKHWKGIIRLPCCGSKVMIDETMTISEISK